MEFCNDVGSMSKICRSFPCGLLSLVIAFPLDQVLDPLVRSSAPDSGLEDLFDLVFLFSFD